MGRKTSFTSLTFFVCEILQRLGYRRRPTMHRLKTGSELVRRRNSLSIRNIMNAQHDALTLQNVVNGEKNPSVVLRLLGSDPG